MVKVQSDNIRTKIK